MQVQDKRQFVIVCGFLAIHAVALSLAGPLVPQYAMSMGASPSLVGIVVGLGALVPVGTSIPAGFLTDRIGPLRVLFWGLLANSMGYLAVVSRPSMASLALSQVPVGFSSFLVMVSGQAYVARIGADRQANFGRYTAWVGIGNL